MIIIKHFDWYIELYGHEDVDEDLCDLYRVSRPIIQCPEERSWLSSRSISTFNESSPLIIPPHAATSLSNLIKLSSLKHALYLHKRHTSLAFLLDPSGVNVNVQSRFGSAGANVENGQFRVFRIGHRHLKDRPALQIFLWRFPYEQLTIQSMLQIREVGFEKLSHVSEMHPPPSFHHLTLKFSDAPSHL